MGEILLFAVVAIIVVVIAYVVIRNIIDEAKYRLDKGKNFFVGQEGMCVECKYCVRDESHQYSNTGYFCRLSNCENITENTVMRCLEKPTITEDDLEELFKLGIWTASGQTYLRNELLGRKMTFSELDEYLTKFAAEHQEHIDQSKKREFTSNSN